MSATADAVVVEVDEGPVGPWWWFLITGIAWVLISFMVLAFDPTSAATIGYLVAFVLIAAGITEFVNIPFADSWKWVHGLLGLLFLVTGIMALTEPFQTFGIMALLIGWFLLFKGTFTIVLSLAARHELPLWGLLLATGIREGVVGVWAIGYPGRSAWLLILWVGIGALMRGITEIITAFGIHHAQKAVA